MSEHVKLKLITIIKDIKLYFEMYKNDLKSFFKFINEECLFYKITIMADGTIDMKWDELLESDYDQNALPIENKIVLRIQRAKNQLNFLDL